MNDKAKNQAVAAPMPNRVANPFQSDRREVAVGASGEAMVQREVAEVKAMIMLAKQFPRDKFAAMDRILSECCNEGLAELASYSFPRGGQEVEGPSIRLAEVVAQNWGNFDFGWNEVNRAGGASEVVAFAWDLETNVRRSMKFYVKHWRDTKGGGYALKDERDIYELCANQAQRRVRACILNVIPRHVVDAAVAQCEATLTQKANVTPDQIKALLTAFEAFGVSKSQIEKRIGRKAEAINGAVLTQLRKIYAGIKDGMGKPEEYFEPEAMPEQAKAAEGQTAEPPKAQEQADAAPADDWDSVVDELLPGVATAKSVEELDGFAEENGKLIEGLAKSGNKAAIKKWATAFGKRRTELNGGKLV